MNANPLEATALRGAKARVKLSGCRVPGRRWTAELQAPVVLEAARLLGAERRLVASNVPVDGLLAICDEVMGGVRTILAALPVADQHRILHGTAAETHRIAAAAP